MAGGAGNIYIAGQHGRHRDGRCRIAEHGYIQSSVSFHWTQTLNLTLGQQFYLDQWKC